MYPFFTIIEENTLLDLISNRSKPSLLHSFINQGNNKRIFRARALPAELLLLFEGKGRIRTCDPMFQNPEV